MKDFNEIILHKFPKQRIVVLGDLVADQFLSGNIARVSREAPVFILSHDSTETLAGGGANAAVNVANLGATAIAVGIIGKDNSGEALFERLQDAKVDCSYVVRSENFQTTAKIRVLAGQSYAARQQVIRIDYENKNIVSEEIRQKLKENLISACENADAIIISDYTLNPQLGVVNDEIAKLALKISQENNIPLVIDSRFRLENYQTATSATPNQDEIEAILGKEFSEMDCEKLLEKINYESLLVTRGNKGMFLVQKNKPSVVIEAVGSNEPVDVTGAGDTVIATYALSLASGLNFEESAKIANHAGGIVVMKKRTAVVSADELIESLKTYESFDQTAQNI